MWTTAPGTRGVFDRKKLSWQVWADAGTPAESATFDPYLPTIGITEWSEIQFAVPTETTPYPVRIAIDCPGDPSELRMSYNGEKKIPQADGTLRFFNVASDVPQPYELSRDGVVLVSGRIDVTGPVDTLLRLCVLPVEWLAFTATGQEKSVLLDWQTTYEADNAGFGLQRSGDGAEWSDLDRVAAKSSGEEQTYGYLDDAPLTGANYYRVVQTDFDGQRSVSPVRRVDFTGDEDLLTISPNPTEGRFRLGLPAGFRAEELRLVDLSGRTVAAAPPRPHGHGRPERSARR